MNLQNSTATIYINEHMYTSTLSSTLLLQYLFFTELSLSVLIL